MEMAGRWAARTYPEGAALQRVRCQAHRHELSQRWLVQDKARCLQEAALSFCPLAPPGAVSSSQLTAQARRPPGCIGVEQERGKH